jgi:hypothetical protein
MKVEFAPIPKAGLPAVVFLALALVAADYRAAGQSDSLAPSAGSVTAPTNGPLARIAMIGASVTSGYASIRLAGNSSEQLCRLNHYLDSAIVIPHEPVRSFSTPEFFLNAENSARKQIDSALQMQPTMVVGVDFLFWFCYGDHLTEPQRLEKFDRVLKMLEAISCPLIVGDIPDASAATNDLLSVGEVPARSTMEEANRRLDAWASKHPQVSVLKLSALMRSTGTDEKIVLHDNAISMDQGQHGFQPDHLHLLPAGCAILTVAILDALPVMDVAGQVRWDARDIERRTIAAVATAWPEVNTTGTTLDPSSHPVSGVAVAAYNTAPSGSPDTQSDAAGEYAMLWQALPLVQNRRPQAVVVGRDEERNRAGLAELSPTDTNTDIHLQPGLVLSGVIQDSAGHSLTGATIVALMDIDGRSFPISRVTNGISDNGAFALRALPPGRKYFVNVNLPGYERLRVLVPAEETQTNQLVMTPMVLRIANLQVAGQVLGLDDQPFAGAMVTITDTNQPYHAATRTDAFGHFQIKGVYEGPLNVQATFRDSNTVPTMLLKAITQARGGDTNVVVKLESSH